MKIAYAIAATAAATSAMAGDEIASFNYQCDRGVNVAATYINVGDFSGAVLQADGRQIAAVIAQSASGARYVSADEGPKYVWWTKGPEATLYWQEGTEEETTLLTCVEEK